MFHDGNDNRQVDVDDRAQPLEPWSYGEIAWARQLAEAKPPDRRELAHERTTVVGRRAVSLLEQSTGQGMFPEDDRIYRYLVDLGDETFIATAHDGDDPPFQDRADVLDRPFYGSCGLLGRAPVRAVTPVLT